MSHSQRQPATHTIPRGSRIVKAISWFIRPHKIWFPTLLGWFLILGMLATPVVAWWLWGESFLCLTRREPTDILVVEGWAGGETFEAAAAEFARGGYRWIIATGGPDGERWSRKRWTYAEIAHDGLIGAGVPRDRIIMAPCAEVETQRTRESALAVQQILSNQCLHPAALNVFTLGAHARRSQLIYAKVFGSTVKVGIISWLPPGASTDPWWHSTTRAKSILTETIGYLYEALLDSGRGTRPKTISLNTSNASAQ